jgi:hypothetical protein
MAFMRTVILAALLLAACGEEPLLVTIPRRPGTTHLDMSGSKAGTRWEYRLEVTSRVRKQVRLEARLEEPFPEGMAVRVADGTIPREGTAWPWLILVAPPVEGPFRGAVMVTSPDVPDWSLRYTFEGEVVPGGLVGKHLSARPAGMNLGMLRPGEERTFAVALGNIGSEPVTIRGWSAEDAERVRMPRSGDPVTVTPGGEFQLPATVVAPRAAGPFETRVRVDSDAASHPKGLFLQFRGEVVPDYAPNPPRAVERTAFPAEGREFKVAIRARDEVAPFTVAGAAGHERYFEVLSLGTPEPAREQIVTFRLRRDAPTDPDRDAEWQVRLRLEPGGVEVAWPVKIRLNPPIHAQPTSLDFGKVPQGAGKAAEISLTAYANRAFRVTGASAERRQVQVTLPDHAPGTSWRVVVSLPKGLAKGMIDDRVVIDTDDPDVPQLIVPVRGEVR